MHDGSTGRTSARQADYEGPSPSTRYAIHHGLSNRNRVEHEQCRATTEESIMTLYDRIAGFQLKIENTTGGPRKRHEEQYDPRLGYRDDVTAIWMQVGIRDDAVARRAEVAGRRVVQDRCMKVEHGMLRR